ncbi:non-ribosomal peptide synthetase, partial [Clostridium puniceum]|uniref:non-ribosomal peptide synthetase n=1 Tax=Clostridium puniceum TaxID=29367 RepID=UPI0013017978
MEKNNEIKELLLMEEFKEQLTYWEKILDSDLNRNEIPYISSQLNNKTVEAGSVSLSFPKEIAEKILKLSSYKDLNLLIVLSSILKCLLNKYTAQSSNYVITPVLKDNEVNKYNKSTVIKSTVSNTMSFKKIIVSEKNVFSEAYKNSYYPMQVIMDRLGIHKENKSNIFNVGFIFENVHDVDYIKDYNFELLFIFKRNDNTIQLEISYDKSKFKSNDIEDILNRYIILSDNLIKDADLSIGEIDVINEEEKNKIIKEFNKTESPYEKEKTIQELFEEQAEKTPNNIAVLFEGNHLTYKELNKKSNQLALQLREKGVKSNVIVGIMVERSLEMMVGIMAILKAGGAYLPISPQYPINRIEYIVENSGMKLLLTQSSFIEKTEELKGKADIINLNNKDIFTGKDTNLELVNTSKDLAYIIYTSGSTGNPKGVMIEHHSVINRLNWMQNKYPIGENDVILQKTPFTFDVSVWELFWWSFVGAKVCMLCPDGEKDPQAIIDAVNKYNVTTMHFVPSMLSIFLSYIENSSDKESIKDLRSLKQVFSSGEALNVEQVNRFNAVINSSLGAKLSNLYGPTEATVDVTYFDCSEGQELKLIPIGKPIDNIKLYVLNENKRLQPVGVQGELYISGVGVARGYLNREELTKEKFIDNPFELGTKMYKTGDLARWISDGNIEYLGRIDNQVKIRGLRIEIGEIETQLLKSEEIKEAVVIDRCDSNGEKYLCAYVTSDEAISSLTLREELLDELPAYMIPNYIVQIEKLPLTANGKLDRKALPEPDVSQMIEKEYEEARNKIEECLVKVWEEVLGIEGIGISHNYYELGGDSIKSIQIVSRLQKYDISLQVKDIMENPTIKQLSEKAKYKTNEIDQSAVEGEAELTPIQKWFFENEFSQNNHWNQAFVLYKKDGIKEEILKKSFVEILKHHDALRMIYKEDGDTIKQENRGLELVEEAFTLDVYDLKEEENYKNTIEKLSNKLQEGMDLEKGILVKLGIFNTKEGDYLLIAIHHIVVDGVSWRILFEDLETLYEAIENEKHIVLPKKTISYKEWAGKLLEHANSKEILKELEYWRNIENLQVKELPRDFQKCESDMEESKSISITFTREETERLLRKTSTAYNTQINDILLCSLGLAVKDWSGNEKTLINLEGHGREEIIKDISIDRTIGWFTSMYPVILDMTCSEDISYSIQNTKETLRHVPNNGIGYGLLKYLTSAEYKKNTDFKLKPEIIFNYLGELSQKEDKKLFNHSDLTGGMSISDANKKLSSIDINSFVSKEELKVMFNYSIKEYKEETIEELIKIYKNHLINIIEHCENKKEAQKTPWDYGDDNLSIEDLNKILSSEKNIEKIHLLAPMQEGILYNSMLNKGSYTYFEQFTFEIAGTLKLKMLQDSINSLVEKHEILRTAFFYDGITKPKQAVLRKREIGVNYEDISSFDEEKKKGYIEEFKKTDRDRGFDLTKDCLIRVSVIKIKNNRYKLVYSFHHIIMDGWCIGIIMQEAIDGYKALCLGKEVVFEKTEPYSKYLQWLDKQDKSEALGYWQSYLNEYKQEVTLPTLNRKSNSFNNKEEVITLETAMTSNLKGIAEANNITINAVIQTAWGILLQKYNSADDVVFGSVISGRPSEVKDIEKMVGLFINTVPVRIKGEDNTEFKELAKKLNQDFIEANVYNYCSLAEVQSLTDMKNKLINHIVVYENYPLDEKLINTDMSGNEANIVGLEGFEQINYDFGIIISPGNKLSIRIMYNGNAYSKEIINSIGDNLYNVLNSVALNPSVKLSEIDMISEEEKNKIIKEFNKTESPYEKEKTIQELFEEQAEKTPNNIAVLFEGNHLTYKELNKKSNQLALQLREKGVKSNVIVGIMVERSLEMMVGIMAILKAGGAYLPISPQYPINRIEYIVENSGMKLLLTQSSFIEKTEELKGKADIINLNNKDIFTGKDTNLELVNTSKDLAYIIYTSGSTGNPKGVMIEHHSVINRLNWMQNKYPIGENDVILQKTPFTFDVSVWELFWWSFVGAKVCMLCPDGEKDPQAIIDAVNKYNVTTMHFVPSMLSIFLSYIENSSDKESIKDLRSLKQVFSSGEALNVEQVNRFNAVINSSLGAKLSNLYGPTEATVDVTYFDCSEGQELKLIPIGKPIDNIKLYVLNENKRLQPVGVQGELYISGVGVARGYLNREELTKEKFIDNPFELGTKMYKTGDLARWISDGNIEYLGRIDNQVKIRGLRIEIGEIETQLLKSEEIKEAVVIDRCDSNGEKYLCAYVTSDEAISSLTLREELLDELPAYMIPNHIVQIEKLPLTANGKLDRKALPEPDVSQMIEKEYEEARNKIEECLVKVWEEVLGIEGIGISHNYYELGGDSIKSIQIVSRLQKYDISLQVKDIMENPTIKQLSEKAKYKTNEIDQSAVEGEAELTPIQKWFFENEFSQNNHWNQAFVLYKKDGIKEETIRKSFVEIIKHHDALRMIYEKDGDEIKQKNRGLEAIESAFTLDAYDLKEDENYKNTIEELSSKLQEGMDLEKGILLKLGIFNTKEGDYLLIAIHHMVVDGVSWRILFEDLETLYKAIEMQEEMVLPQKTTSYKEWTRKLSEYAYSKEFLKELEYWKSTDNTLIREISRDYGKAESNVKDSRSVSISFSKAQTEKLLRKTSTAYNTQINDILLCSLGLAVKEWSGNDKVLISLEGHGREEIIKDVSIDRTIGWFTSIYPVVLDMAYSEDISYSIQQTKETLRHIPNNGIGYGILKYLACNQNNKDISFKLKPEISFNYLGEFMQKESKDSFSYSKLTGGMTVSTANKELYSIEINGIVSEGKLQIFLNYSTKEYKKETIKNLLQVYKTNLIKVVEHCESKKETQKTPWDYGDNELSIEDLNKILSSGKDIEKIHSLAPMQEGMLYNLILDKNSHAYFEQSVLTLEGTLRGEILNKVFNILLEKYEALRTAFFYEDISKPKQAILSKREMSIHYEDISNLNEEKKEKYIEEFKKADRDRGFDLTNDCLIRVSVIKIKDNKYKLIYDFHHIIMDGWCVGIIIDEIVNMYKALYEEKEIVIDRAEPYSNYLEWLGKQDKTESLEYWKNYLQGYEQETVIPTIKKKSQSFKPAEEQIILDNLLTRKLKSTAESNNITMNAVIQTVWSILLQKYNNTDDVVFGSVISGRPSEIKGIERMVGLFINTVPIRVKSTKDIEFRELAQKLNKDFIHANAYGYCSLAEIQALTDMKNRLINHVTIYENYPINEEMMNSNKYEKSELSIVDFENFEQTNYNLELVIMPGRQLNIKLAYNCNVYSNEIIKSIKNNFHNLLNCVISKPNIKLAEIDIVSTEERNKLLNEFNKTESEYQKEKTIQELFEEQVKNIPNNVALVYEGNKLTYKELNEKANSLARVLREKNVQAENLVGIMAEKSFEMIIGMLSILKAGGVYLPIDPEYPKERIEYILRDSKTRIILTQNKYVEGLYSNVEVVNLEDSRMYEHNCENLQSINTSIDLAYIIYTSGSTGQPKGVMVEHRNVYNLCNWYNKKYNIELNKNTLQMTNISFDVSVEEIFGALLNGGTIYIPNKDILFDRNKFKDYIDENKINLVQFVPATLSELIAKNNKMESLNVIICGGDRLDTVLKDNVLSKGYKLYNHYGPTETTVDAICTKCNESNVIGKPIQNTQVYILDKDQKLQPMGVSGEICIAGKGVARGYFNRLELTKEKFVNNPFIIGERIYKTGDLGRWLPNGSIEFLGRIDNQVKIRGFRIELGEVESHILKISMVNEAVVIDRINDKGDKYLCAYITAETQISAALLREKLLNEIPSYMIPSYIAQIEKLPLTPNGKVDKKALPEPDLSEMIENEYEAPRNNVEEILVNVWKEVLGIYGIGINHNYYELGGDSIKSIQIVSRLQRYDVKLQVKDIMQYPNIKQLSKMVKHGKLQIDQSAVEGEVELAPIQKWFFENEFLEKNHWNQAFVFYKKDGIKEEILKKSFAEIIKHHDALRMIYEKDEAKIKQRNRGLEAVG